MNRSMDFGFFVVAYIDLQGQTNELKRFQSAFRRWPANDAEKREFLERAEPIWGRVRSFRDAVNDLREIMCRPIPIPESIKVQAGQEYLALCEKYAIRSVGVQFIGDAALLKVPLRTDYSPLPSIWSLLDQLAIHALYSIGYGRPIRGGVEVGICSEIESNDLYGAAVSEAYFLESTVAEYPRIVIGNQLLEYLDTRQHSGGSQAEQDFILSIVQKIREMLALDTDGHQILSYLRPAVLSALEDPQGVRECVAAASRFIAGEIEKFERLRDSDFKKLVERYLRLKRYFQDSGCWIET